MHPEYPPPQGYEYTGEWRLAKHGELYASFCGALCGPTLHDVWIVRPIGRAAVIH